MKSVIVENLEFKISKLEEELAGIENLCRLYLTMGKTLERRTLMRMSQLKTEIEFVKQQIRNHSASGVRKK